MLALKKIMQFLVSFSLSFKYLGPQTFSSQIIKTLNSKRHMSMSVSEKLYLEATEVVN
jgi:hypothetical protein